ncbi:MAG: geranylgeranyl reductase family protein [Candidatus Aenigmarchaeota archaeon]|nr:geranylgeranyl reductase family protein [Candidatus Aenigmarchaeota archaeon]
MNYEVIIIGSGPSGSIASMYLGKKLGKEKVLIVDKATFPRDKICGDAQGRKAARILNELGIYEEYTKLPGQPIYGLTLSSPNGTQINLDVEARDKPAPGYTHKRKVLDNFLHENAAKMATFKQFTVTDVIIEDKTVKGIIGEDEHGKKEEIRAKIVLAADGANSTIAQKFGLNKNPPEDFIVATRQYYKGVAGLTDRIEIHMVKNLIPGYFWIFPMGNGEANVGLGMIVKDMNSKKVNLREATLKEIKENPLFKDRFKNATPLEDVKGWNLPVASHHRKCYGNGILFLGDAASLIDPLSGEGIGNAMISARTAAEVVIEALQKQDFSEKFLQKYDKMLWDIIGNEIKTSTKVQKLGKMFPFMIDKLLVKASKDEKFRKKVEAKLPYTAGREEIGSASFLMELAPEEEEVHKASKEL